MKQGISQDHKFDALIELEHQQWKEYETKVNLEWRLSFGIWTALLAVISGILSNKIQTVLLTQVYLFDPMPVSCFVFIFILSLHTWFLLWIHSRLKETRSSLHKIRDMIIKISEENVQPKYHMSRSSIYVQIFITALLGFLFLLSVFAALKNPNPCAKYDTQLTLIVPRHLG